MRLANKVALITGGTSGIGHATALLFAEEGARVAITGRNRERGNEVVTELERLGSKGLFIQADVRLAADCGSGALAARESRRFFGSDLSIKLKRGRGPKVASVTGSATDDPGRTRTVACESDAPTRCQRALSLHFRTI